MEYSPAELRVAVQIGQDVIRDYAEGRPVQGGGGPHVPRVCWQLAWSKSDRGRDSTEKKMPAKNQVQNCTSGERLLPTLDMELLHIVA